MTDFELLVYRMRMAQKNYNMTREKRFKWHSKKLEKQVDSYLFDCVEADLFGGKKQ